MKTQFKSFDNTNIDSPVKFGSPHSPLGLNLSPTDMEALQGLGIKATIAAMEELKEHLNVPIPQKTERADKKLLYNMLSFDQE
jgi:hypothetical protein